MKMNIWEFKKLSKSILFTLFFKGNDNKEGAYRGNLKIAQKMDLDFVLFY